MQSTETPMGLALLLCDSVIEDKYTGKKTLVGLFDRIQTLKLPCIHASMSIFVSLTGGHGKYPCQIEGRHSDGETTAFSATGNVILKDPHQVANLVFRMNNVKFNKAGMYWVRFTVDDMPIMLRQLIVLKKEQPQYPDAEQ